MKLQYDMIANLPNKINDFLMKHDGNAPMALYGGGKSCYQLVRLLRAKGIEPMAIMDADQTKWGSNLWGIEIVAPDNLLEKVPDLEVFISAASFEPQIRKVLRHFLPENRIHFFEYERYFYSDIEATREFVSSNRKAIDDIVAHLSDTRSIETLNGIVSVWCSADPKYLENIYTPNQYFPPDLIVLDNNESFVDCGAYIGDTYLRFSSLVNRKYNHYYGFEPQPDSFQTLRNICEDDKRNTLFQCGASDKNGRVGFVSENVTGQAAIVDERGDSFIDIVRMDSLISGRVSYIKMDIEGSELDALRGAESLMLTYRPRLAICIYHKVDDILEIPKYVINLTGGGTGIIFAIISVMLRPKRFFMPFQWSCK